MALKTAYFAAGCFWGVEYYFKKLDGVVDTTVGYSGGWVENPTYEQVKTGTTGHYETVKIVYDDQQIDYEDLVKYFFEIHDFSQRDGQGPDIGHQYLSRIFIQNSEQKQIAQKIINYLKAQGYDVATEIIEFQKFWPAEEYHQDYYDKNNNLLPYCHYRRKIFKN